VGRNKAEGRMGRRQPAGHEDVCSLYRRLKEVSKIWGDVLETVYKLDQRLGKGGWVNKIWGRKEMCSPIRRVLKGRVGEPEEGCIFTMFCVICARL